MSLDYQGVRRVKCNLYFFVVPNKSEKFAKTTSNSAFMNKSILPLIIIAMTFVIADSTASFSYARGMQQDPLPIEFYPVPQNPGEGPRTQTDIPFSAYRGAYYVTLLSVVDYGVVDVELYSTAGDSISMLFDTSEESIMIPISGEAGDYTITITDQQGQIYIGLFSIL